MTTSTHNLMDPCPAQPSIPVQDDPPAGSGSGGPPHAGAAPAAPAHWRPHHRPHPHEGAHRHGDSVSQYAPIASVSKKKGHSSTQSLSPYTFISQWKFFLLQMVANGLNLLSRSSPCLFVSLLPYLPPRHTRAQGPRFLGTLSQSKYDSRDRVGSPNHVLLSNPKDTFPSSRPQGTCHQARNFLVRTGVLNPR